MQILSWLYRILHWKDGYEEQSTFLKCSLEQEGFHPLSADAVLSLYSLIPGRNFGWIKPTKRPGIREASSRVLLWDWSIIVICSKKRNLSNERYALGHMRILKQFHRRSRNGKVYHPGKVKHSRLIRNHHVQLVARFDFKMAMGNEGLEVRAVHDNAWVFTSSVKCLGGQNSLVLHAPHETKIPRCSAKDCAKRLHLYF
jgi:hypothetical protein